MHHESIYQYIDCEFAMIHLQDINASRIYILIYTEKLGIL